MPPLWAPALDLLSVKRDQQCNEPACASAWVAGYSGPSFGLGPIRPCYPVAPPRTKSEVQQPLSASELWRRFWCLVGKPAWRTFAISSAE